MIHRADFTALAQANVTSGNLVFNETAFAGNITLWPRTQPSGQDLQFGVLDLTPLMVGEIITAVADGGVRACAPDTTVARTQCPACVFQ